MEKIYVTQEGYDKLVEEREYLIHTARPQYKEDLVAARAQGDLSENADYDAARDLQSKVENRIAELQEMLKVVEIIDEKQSGKAGNVVKIGSTVTVQFLDDNTEETFVIVGSVEADPINGKLSNETPMAKAILDHKAGDVCTVDVDTPYDVKIVKC